MKIDFASFTVIMSLIVAVVVGIWWLFYFLWNTIAADIFGLPDLTFWQSVGLLILIGLVTSGFRSVVTKS